MPAAPSFLALYDHLVAGVRDVFEQLVPAGEVDAALCEAPSGMREDAIASQRGAAPNEFVFDQSDPQFNRVLIDGSTGRSGPRGPALIWKYPCPVSAHLDCRGDRGIRSCRHRQGRTMRQCKA